MISFEFSNKVIDRVISEISDAEEYIRIAIFQLHNPKIFELLQEKLAQGVKVEILTLPLDSVNESFQEEVTKNFEVILDSGAILYYCRWNIGNPERTTTAIGRWYSFHGKFIVTEKVALALSANFTSSPEIDALLIFREDQKKIIEFNSKFDFLLRLFITSHSGSDGTIKSKIISSGIDNARKLISLPRIIESKTHENHWILDYPETLCPRNIKLDTGLFISPFEIRARDALEAIVDYADDFLLISTESFTDPEFHKILIKASLKGVRVKILTDSNSKDFSDRLQQNLRYLLSSGIEIRKPKQPLHAKLIITDHLVMVGSINLNRMNLGFASSSGLWRGNTETFTIVTDEIVNDSAKKQFLEIFSASDEMEISLAKKLEAEMGIIFNSYYGLKSRKKVKTLFSKFILTQEIEVKKTALKIGEITKLLIGSRSMVEVNDFLMALILCFLAEHKSTIEQIKGRMGFMNQEYNIDQLVQELVNRNYIEKDDDYYKLSVLALFRR